MDANFYPTFTTICDSIFNLENDLHDNCSNHLFEDSVVLLCYFFTLGFGYYDDKLILSCFRLDM